MMWNHLTLIDSSGTILLVGIALMVACVFVSERWNRKMHEEFVSDRTRRFNEKIQRAESEAGGLRERLWDVSWATVCFQNDPTMPSDHFAKLVAEAVGTEQMAASRRLRCLYGED